MRRRTLLVLAVLLSLSIAGCGDPGGSASDRGAEPTTPSVTPPSTTASPSSTASPSPTGATTPPSGALEKVRVVGEVVEVGDCVVVRDDNDTTWTIAGDLASTLVTGDRVQVTGAPDLVATGCGGPVIKAARVAVVG